MSPNPLSCIDANMRTYLGGLFHHIDIIEMINTKNGKAKIYAIFLSYMDQWSTELKGCAKHVEP
jgi:hypothetical protein